MTSPTDRAGDHVPGQLDLHGRPAGGRWTPEERADLERELAELRQASEQLDMALLAYRAEALQRITAATSAAAAAAADLDAAVAEARGMDVTWQQIADAAGMTRQSAWRRWRTPDEVDAP